MRSDPNISYAYSKHGTVKPREIFVWTSGYVLYKIYICEWCILQIQNTIYCCQY